MSSSPTHSNHALSNSLSSVHKVNIYSSFWKHSRWKCFLPKPGDTLNDCEADYECNFILTIDHAQTRWLRDLRSVAVHSCCLKSAPVVGYSLCVQLSLRTFQLLCCSSRLLSAVSLCGCELSLKQNTCADALLMMLGNGLRMENDGDELFEENHLEWGL